MFVICASVFGVNVRSAGWRPAMATATAVVSPAITITSPSQSARRARKTRFMKPSLVGLPLPCGQEPTTSSWPDDDAFVVGERDVAVAEPNRALGTADGNHDDAAELAQHPL